MCTKKDFRRGGSYHLRKRATARKPLNSGLRSSAARCVTVLPRRAELYRRPANLSIISRRPGVKSDVVTGAESAEVYDGCQRCLVGGRVVRAGHDNSSPAGVTVALESRALSGDGRLV